MRTKLVSSILIVACLSGCFAYRGLRSGAAIDAVEDFNSVQEDVQTRLLAINILRAKNRLPRQFSAITNGQVLQSTTVRGGPLTFFDDRSAVNTAVGSTAPKFAAFELFKRTLNLSADVQSSPRVDIAALDTKEFYTGMASTVRYDVLHYFQRQGWPAHLMALIFIRELQFGNDRITSHPSTSDSHQRSLDFQRFLKLTELMARSGLELKSVTRDATASTFVGPPMCIEQTSILESQVLAGQNGYRLYKVKDGCVSAKDGVGWALGKPVLDNYWSFDACRAHRALYPTLYGSAVRPNALQATDSTGFSEFIQAQVWVAWRNALSKDNVTKSDAINSALVSWREKIAQAATLCQDKSDCWQSPHDSLEKLLNPVTAAHIPGVCSELQQFQSIRQGRCDEAGIAQGKQCAVDPNISVAQISINALAPAEQNILLPGRALLRSPESIIYFLGQLVRMQEASIPANPVQYWTDQSGTEKWLTLFSLRQITQDESKESDLTVQFLGDTYGIVRSDSDRSMSTLSAVLTLIGLQRSASDLPTTPTVNIIGGG